MKQQDATTSAGDGMQEGATVAEAMEAYRSGDLELAAEIGEQLLAATPNDVAAFRVLAAVAAGRADLARAVELLEQGTRVAPQDAETWLSLGRLLAYGHRLEAAAEALAQAAALATKDASPQAELGDVLQSLGRPDEALKAYAAALGQNSKHGQAWYGKACVQAARGRYAEALVSYRRAAELDPEDGRICLGLGRAYFELGEVDASLGQFRRADELLPDALAAMEAATAVTAASRVDQSEILSMRCACAERCGDGHQQPVPRHASPTDRPLRVGYLSAWFGHRDLMRPVWALINSHDRGAVEVHCFSDCPRTDVGAEYRADPQDRFHETGSLDNDDLAVLIAREEIELLVTLDGYSCQRRLPLLAQQSAPVVAAWLGSRATSGFRAVHWLIGDEYVVTPADEEFYLEKIARVPGSALTFEVGYPVPDVGPPPCLKSGWLTFGSLAPMHRVTPLVIAAWAEILRAVPEARLLVRNAALDAEANRRYLIERLATHGVVPTRVTLEGTAEQHEHLHTYDRVDIALDTFPENGMATTIEALWQGVPVLTFDGDRWASRTSKSILCAGGLSEFVTTGRQAFVDQGIRLANDPETPSRLATLRSRMRQRLGASPVCDTHAFARAMEGIYRQLLAGDA